MSRVTCSNCGQYPAVASNGFTVVCRCKNKKPTTRTIAATTNYTTQKAEEKTNG